MEEKMKKILNTFLIKKCLLILTFFFFSFSFLFSADLKVGIMLPLTGDAAPYGIGAKKGAELAFEKLKVPGVKLVVEDSGCDGRTAINAINKLINVEKVVAIVGELCSSATLAVAPVAEQKKVVLISPASTSPDITDAGDYIFRTVPTDARQGVFAADLLRREGIKNLAVLYPNEDYGKGFSGVLEKSFKEKGGRVVASESFERGSTDLRTQLTKIRARRPDAVFLISNSPNSAIEALRQMRELRVNVKLFGSEGLKSKEIAQARGADGLIITSVSPGSKQFADEHKRFFNEEAGPFSAQAYDAYESIARAIKGGAKTGEQIKNALYKLSFNGATGRVKFDRKGDVSGSYDIYVVRNKEFVKR